MSEAEWKVEGQESKGSQVEIPDVLPLLPIRDIVIYPYMMLPLFVGRDVSIRAVEESLSRDRLIFLVSQKNSAEEAQVRRTSTASAPSRRSCACSNSRTAESRFLSKVCPREKSTPTCASDPFFEVKIRKVIEPTLPEVPIEVEALMRTAKEKIEQILNLKNLPPEIVMVTDNISDPGVLADLVASNLRLKIEESQAILEIFDPIERLKKVNELLSRELELSTMQARIQNQAKEEMSKTQRDYFLREQLKQIQQELGEGDERTEEINELKKQLDKAKMPVDVKREADKQLKRLEQMHPESSEASLVRTYLDWLVDLPWSKKTKDNLNIKKAKTGPRRRSLQPGEDKRTDSGIPRGQQAEAENQGPDSVLCRSSLGSEKLLWDDPSPAPWGETSSAYRWAVFAMRRRFVAIGEPMSALCRVVSFRELNKRAQTIRSSCSMKSTKSGPTSVAILRRRCLRF